MWNVKVKTMLLIINVTESSYRWFKKDLDGILDSSVEQKMTVILGVAHILRAI